MRERGGRQRAFALSRPCVPMKLFLGAECFCGATSLAASSHPRERDRIALPSGGARTCTTSSRCSSGRVGCSDDTSAPSQPWPRPCLPHQTPPHRRGRRAAQPGLCVLGEQTRRRLAPHTGYGGSNTGGQDRGSAPWLQGAWAQIYLNMLLSLVLDEYRIAIPISLKPFNGFPYYSRQAWLRARDCYVLRAGVKYRSHSNDVASNCIEVPYVQ
eukprot:5582346-Pleurochrysis_carterae.AAC.1